MRRCITCLMPDTRPDISFDEHGECSACRAYKARPEIDWDARKEELLNLLERHKGRVIVPSSGGKDSTYQAITLKELGADVIAVTARTCHLTPLGRANIDNLARHVPTIEYVPNMDQRGRLNKLGLEMVGDISWPEHAAIFSTPFRAAVHLNTPLIMYGENPQNQYGGPNGSQEAKQMTRRWTQEFGGFLGLRVSDVAEMGFDMRDYSLPAQEDLDRLGAEAHFLGQYIPWGSHYNAEIARRHGFQARRPYDYNWWEHENLDNAQTGIHDYFGFLKYGYSRACSQWSVDLRLDPQFREVGFSSLMQFEGKFPDYYAGIPTSEILDRIGIDGRAFVDICNQYINPEIFGDQQVRWGERLYLTWG